MRLGHIHRIFAIVVLTLMANVVWANCEFETHEYRDELSDPSQIEHIAVEIAKSRKWFKNSISILTSDERNIDDRYKDRLKATITVSYSFGDCAYPARVRQSGDWKDHIKLIQGGNVVSSLDVRLYEGNILNAVRFKLLLPETRNGLHEVLATLLLRELGYIAPETFMVSADINGVAETFLFQENAEKELLERNLRREGPIFEGDESILWNVDGFEPFDLEDISLARLSNDNWAEKGETSLLMALNAFDAVQNAYLIYADEVDPDANEFRTQIIPNTDAAHTDFESYALLSIAMHGSHSLRPHNRRYYFNSFIQDFEPIYYDGNVNFLRRGTSADWDDVPGVREYFITHADPVIMDRLEAEIMRLKEDDVFRQAFLQRVGGQTEAAASLFSEGLEITVENFAELQADIKNASLSDQAYSVPDLQAARTRYVERAGVHGIVTDVIELDRRPLSGRLIVQDGDNSQINLTPGELVKVMSDNSYNDRRTVLLAKPDQEVADKFVTVPFLDGEIVSSFGATATVDTQERTLIVTQTNPTDWVLVRGATIEDWTVTFEGGAQDPAQQSAQRFNEFGLTGCLNFYDVTFIESHLFGYDGQCEDSINLVSSRGTLATFVVEDGFADAIDIDFSEVVIEDLRVSRTGNDCFDVSTGIFTIERGQLSDCGDKGISVGENSLLDAADVTIESAVIGVSSKDFSKTNIQNLAASDVAICVEAFQKKQEFGGGLLTIGDYDCVGEINQDAASAIVLNGLMQ